jgi:uncharacterized membrane protein YhiD involved in acid resistance
MSTNPASSITLPPAPRRRFRWLRTLLVFIAGIVVGAALCVIFIVHRVEHAIHHPEEAPPRITRYLTRKLDLSPSQHDQVLTIIQQRQQALLALRQEIRPKLNTQLDELRIQIDGVLNPDQQAKWEKLYHDTKDRWMPDLPATQPIER